MNMSFRLAQLSILTLALWASPALAQRICILDIPGAGGAAVRKQLSNELCDAADCAAPSQVTTGGKPDARKAKRELVQYLVSGAVTKKGRALNLSVLAVARNNAVAARKSLPLERGQLSAKNLRAAADFIRGAMGEAAPAPTAAPAAELPPQGAPAPEPEQASAPPPSLPLDGEPAEPRGAGREPAESVSASERPARKSPGIAVELGTDMLNRHFGYSDATSGNLRQYDLTLYPLPSIRAELYPFALAGMDALAGLALEGSFAYAPFLKSRRTSGTDYYPTSAMRMDAGIHWRLLPMSNYGLAISPFAGLRVQSFILAASSTGDRLDGIPNLQFVSVRAGVGLEAPVVQDSVIIIARLAVLPVFSAAEIISPTYFPSGSAFGFEGGFGVAVQIAAPLQFRATFEYTQYSLSFQASSSNLYAATGAVDRYLGGNLALRLQL
jgi:hypothetical protein